jgi:hypothetical protein
MFPLSSRFPSIQLWDRALTLGSGEYRLSGFPLGGNRQSPFPATDSDQGPLFTEHGLICSSAYAWSALKALCQAFPRKKAVRLFWVSVANARPATRRFIGQSSMEIRLSVL